MVAARQHHVVPYLAANLDRLDIPGQARSELEAAAGRQHAGAAVLAADLSVALAALRDAGVRALAFKGVALAAQAYGDFAIRGRATSICSSPRRISTAPIGAVTALAGAPAARIPSARAVVGLAPLRAHGQRAHAQSVAQSDIDLHWHLVPTRGTFPDFDTLWDRREVVIVDGHPTPTLSRYDALAHSAGHAAKDRWRWMRSLLDVHALMCRPRHLARRRPAAPRRPAAVRSAWPLASSARRRSCHRSSVRQPRDGRRRAVDAACIASRSTTAPAAPTLRRCRAQLPRSGCAELARTEASLREAARLLSRSALPAVAHRRAVTDAPRRGAAASGEARTRCVDRCAGPTSRDQCSRALARGCDRRRCR